MPTTAHRGGWCSPIGAEQPTRALLDIATTDEGGGVEAEGHGSRDARSQVGVLDVQIHSYGRVPGLEPGDALEPIETVGSP